MSAALLYAVTGLGLFSLGFYALIVQPHLLRKILALNIMGSGVFLVLTALARRAPGGMPDPVPHAMVITGIVVAVAATALALVLLRRVVETTGQARLPDPDSE
ncbi:NADH-quinone oxidoreductase subunit K [Thiohalophilus sp.]|uniref:NADH-quinone oxidoreductase subunit K n=1 Tax=Thiohalophilus sp. TaxID=3028392 RepID=UPI002ACEE251|nr:NADH-quinone oxidoreductase subunit K [Thiohalophilus sp.]MDZ7662706.1 NADH-quinone oxidoreductase subunit K [Thiohalophilus sp.]